jgi:hypothetical protein
MKIIQLMLYLIIALLLNVSTGTTQMNWESPWIPDGSTTLRSLIDEEYQIISTNTVYASNYQFTIEYIYLQKGNDLYRCVTMLNVTTREKQHGCERLSKTIRRR